jgi:small-conductance mechanosensitive channel
VLNESDAAALAEKTETDIDETGEQPYPVRWALVRLLRLGLAVTLFVVMPVAWGARPTYTSDVIDALNYKISIGNIEFNSMGILYAGVFIFVIHILSVVMKSLMKNKILENKKIDIGLKDSIVRITLYTVWGIGFIIVLRLIGISATSLAVVFGAVGIGIGFGLQTMFNNFFSGLILLFERPIQVNDVIEIGGVWGVVKEIKVRSTHIKTYDNADLMIPNSEIVGQQVTNWSFKDPRIRRTITIGVAYGSDIKLVKETLVNIAYNDPRVSRRPNPDVLFADFGDNALIFKLRFWAHVDYFLRVESDIRSEIDKEFRRLGIGIPFPQRDVYIKEVQQGRTEPQVGPVCPKV